MRGNAALKQLGRAIRARLQPSMHRVLQANTAHAATPASTCPIELFMPWVYVCQQRLFCFACMLLLQAQCNEAAGAAHPAGEAPGRAAGRDAMHQAGHMLQHASGSMCGAACMDGTRGAALAKRPAACSTHQAVHGTQHACDSSKATSQQPQLQQLQAGI